MSTVLVKLSEDLASCALTQKAAHLEASVWANVEDIARQLANGLRSHGQTEDHHEIVGATSLPQTLTTLLDASREGTSEKGKPSRIPQPVASPAAYELLRVGANLCMDHDINRGRLLAAEYPQAVLSILQSYSDLLLETQSKAPSGTDSAAILTVGDLKIIKTGFGVLLNASMEYKPVRSLLLEREAPATILRLTSLVYPAGLWLSSPTASTSDEELADLWSWRSGLSAWSWRAIDTLRPTENDVAWDEQALPNLIKSLDTFSPRGPEASSPFPQLPSFVSSRPDLRHSLLAADMSVVEEVCMLVDALTTDEERVRALLLISTGKASSASSLDSPFVHLIRFAETGGPLPYWRDGLNEQKSRPQWEKTLGVCKGAVIKAIVTVAGEKSQMDVLWGANDPNGGWFVEKMLTWIREYPASKEARNDEERDDLVICGTLCLGNLARTESRCVTLAGEPISIVPQLVSLLVPSTDIKLKHGVLGLLKNLAQTQKNQRTLGEAGTIKAIFRSKVLERDGDIADMVQLSAIGVVKHLATGHVINALQVFAPVEGGNNGLEQILELIRRTDSLPLRNESTRVLVNLIKTLWVPSSSSLTSPIKTSTAGDLGPKEIAERRHALDELSCEEVADALAEMVGRNLKYQVLLNEGTMALTLLASQPLGLPHVITALTSPLGPDAPNPATRSPPISEASTSTSLANEGSATATALDMITQILSPKGRTFEPELRANACSLLTSVGRHDVAIEATDSEKLALIATIKEATRSALTSLASEPIVQGIAIDAASSPPTSPIGSGTSAPFSRDPNLARKAAARTLAAWGPIPTPAS